MNVTREIVLLVVTQLFSTEIEVIISPQYQSPIRPSIYRPKQDIVHNPMLLVGY